MTAAAQKPALQVELLSAAIAGTTCWTSTQVEGIELATGPASAERPMEARIARLESDVAHLRTDVADIKVDIRSIRDKMDSMSERLDGKIDAVGQRLDGKIDAMGQRLDGKIDALGQRFDAIGERLSVTTKWALGLYVGLAAGMFGMMASGFGWI
jgi:hypothetical protein